MTGLFLKLLNVSITASWIVLAVLVLRLFLRKAPKWSMCILWSVVALRLVLPFSPESAISLIPSPEVIPQDIIRSETPAIHSAIPALNSAVNPLFTGTLTPESNLLKKILTAASVVWLAGVGVMLLYSLITFLSVRRQVRESLLYQKNIYICDDVQSPFILGVIRPRIYIPSGMEESCLSHVLAHENAHIRRWDHLWKPLGFLLLTVYWFNPLLWWAYILLCRDIEMACDEKVVAGMDGDGKRDYSEALIACSVHRRIIMACPVAFGEVSVKSRIKSVLCYKKPGAWVVTAAVAVCVIAAACFLTDPVACAHDYESHVTLAATCTERGVEERTCLLCEHTYSAYVDMCEHSYNAGVVIVEPTCVAVGSRKQSCTHCGAEKWSEVEMIPHTAGEPFCVKEPNCAEKGEKTATCTACKAVFTVEIMPTNDVHDMKETVLREPTCTVPGEGVNACSRCSHSESIQYETVAHSYRDIVVSVPTCTQEGSIKRVCSGCGHEIWKTLPASGHFFMRFNRWCLNCDEKNPDYESPYKGSYSLLDDLNKTGTSTPDEQLPVVGIWP